MHLLSLKSLSPLLRGSGEGRDFGTNVSAVETGTGDVSTLLSSCAISPLQHLWPLQKREKTKLGYNKTKCGYNQTPR